MSKKKPPEKKPLDYQPRMAALAAAGELVDKSARDLDYETPERIIARVELYFPEGRIPLDPASADDNPTRALRFLTPKQDGLAFDWNVGTFVNPPYGKLTPPWIEKIDAQAARGTTEIIALLACNRFETEYLHSMIGRANAVCWIRKRVAFLRPSTKEEAEGNPYPSALWGFNADLARFVNAFAPLGRCIALQPLTRGLTA